MNNKKGNIKLIVLIMLSVIPTILAIFGWLASEKLNIVKTYQYNQYYTDLQSVKELYINEAVLSMKSQSLQLTRDVVDLGGGNYAYGQYYLATNSNLDLSTLKSAVENKTAVKTKLGLNSVQITTTNFPSLINTTNINAFPSNKSVDVITKMKIVKGTYTQDFQISFTISYTLNVSADKATISNVIITNERSVRKYA